MKTFQYFQYYSDMSSYTESNHQLIHIQFNRHFLLDMYSRYFIPSVVYDVPSVSLLGRYLSALILVEGMDIDFLHKCALEDCTDQHQFSSAPDVVKVQFVFWLLHS